MERLQQEASNRQRGAQQSERFQQSREAARVAAAENREAQDLKAAVADEDSPLRNR